MVLFVKAAEGLGGSGGGEAHPTAHPDKVALKGVPSLGKVGINGPQEVRIHVKVDLKGFRLT